MTISLYQHLYRSIPKLNSFCTLADIHRRIRALPRDRFSVRVLGHSAGGRPIHHVQYGRGRIKALFLGYPHPNEPIGGASTVTLLELLARNDLRLARQDIEWHVVACIDPDGAALNESWLRGTFSFERYMRGFFRQAPDRQVEWSFPIRYKRYSFNRPIRETRLLMRLLSDVRPDFYYSLHNMVGGGAFFYISEDPGRDAYRRLRAVLRAARIPIHEGEPEAPFIKRFAPGVFNELSIRAEYDCIAGQYEAPETQLVQGATSFEFLRGLNRDALTFVCELPYMKHPDSDSLRPSGETRRELLMRRQLDAKLLSSLLIDEWMKVHSELASHSPFFPDVARTLALERRYLCDWDHRALLATEYDRPATKAERFSIFFNGYHGLLQAYQFVRLLDDSPQTARIRRCRDRVRGEISARFRRLDKAIRFSAFRPVEIRSLVATQLACGLIALGYRQDKPVSK